MEGILEGLLYVQGDLGITLEQICDILEISISKILTGTGFNSKDYLTEDFSNLLKNCPPEKFKLIYDIAKVIINQK